MKKLIYLLVIAFTITACSEEDMPTAQTFMENMYSIEDDPSDPVQHKRYQIYQNYNVPVYFNDTIYAKEIRKDWYGQPVIKYETVDLNWSFDSYTADIEYKYDYIESEEEQLSALNFVEKYLEVCSKSMRPFSIMVANKLTCSSKTTILPDNYFVGFRTLVLHGIASITDEEAIISKSKNIISDMLVQKVLANEKLSEEFESVSKELQAYDRYWSTLACPITNNWHRASYGSANVNMLFHETPYQHYAGYDLVDYFTIDPSNYSNKRTKEEAEEIRRQIVAEIGQYGFIKGSKTLYLLTPLNKTYDLTDFVQAITNMGKDLFTERFGACPLVMKKFNLVYKYITEELEVEL